MWVPQAPAVPQVPRSAIHSLVTPSKRVYWKKITITYNLRNVCQTKDIQPWSESLKSVQVWVIEKSYNWANWATELTADRLAQLVEHRTAVREVAGSNLDRTNTQGLKITEEKVLPL